ncbi:hypothetical protein JCM11491_005794 [Sporobolomyces phaffii]
MLLLDNDEAASAKSYPRSLRLPDELVIQVLTNGGLARADLARCARLALRFLDPVREALYRRVNVDDMVPLVNVAADNDNNSGDDGGLEYGTRGWTLLRTLKSRAGLAEMVREVHFDTPDDASHLVAPLAAVPNSRGGERVETTAALTLSTFLRLGPNVERVSWGLVWGETIWKYVPLLRTVAKFRHVKHLAVPLLAHDGLVLCASELAHLESLTVDKVVRTAGAPVPDDVVVHFAHLKHLDVRSDAFTFDHVEFVEAHSATLETLRIDLAVAVRLQYAKFGRLAAVHLYDCHDEYRPPPTVAAAHSELFWAALAEPTTTVKTLSFENGYRFRNEFEDFLFRRVASHAHFRLAGYPQSVESVGFLGPGSVRLDRVNSLLASVFVDSGDDGETAVATGRTKTTIKRVVVPARLADPGASGVERGELDAVRALCRRVGVELVFVE